MKKYFISAAVVAAMGAGSIYGYRTMNPNDGLSAAQLANIEALSVIEIELPEIVVSCTDPNVHKQGHCMDVGGEDVSCPDNPTKKVKGCKFTGKQTDWCFWDC